MKRQKGHILLSQGEVRPGSVMGQHWGLPLELAEALARARAVIPPGPDYVRCDSSVLGDTEPRWMRVLDHPPVPARRPNHRLSNPVTR